MSNRQVLSIANKKSEYKYTHYLLYNRHNDVSIWIKQQFFVPLPIMSDGNFNRALLPHTPYASGMKAGQQITKMKAVEAFKEFINQHFPDIEAPQRAAMAEEFESLLVGKLK